MRQKRLTILFILIVGSFRFGIAAGQDVGNSTTDATVSKVRGQRTDPSAQIEAPSRGRLDAGQAKAFDKMLADCFPADGPGVVALVAKDGDVLYHKSFGLANLEFKVPMPLDAKFCIGSVTKAITAAGILRLLDQGKLSLEDPVTKYLPDYPAQGTKVKIKHLLSHTSGVHNYNNFDEPHPPGYFTTEYSDEDFIGLFKNIPLDFEPGDRYEYSNSGYSLLGAIIREISGKSFNSFLQDEFCRPLGLKSLSLIEPRLVVSGRTSSYMATGQNFVTPGAESRTFTRAAGGGIETTAVDLFRWCDGLVSERVLQRETFQQATEPFILSNGQASRTGYGWFIGDLDGSPMITHDGLTPGYSSSLVVFPDERVVALILTNCNWYSAERGRELPTLPHRMAATVLGKSFSETNLATSDEIERLCAVYVDKNGGKVTVSSSQNQLFMQKVNGRRMPLFRIKENCYYVARSYETIQFNMNESKIESVTIAGCSPGHYQRTDESLPRRSLAQDALDLIRSGGAESGLRLLNQNEKSDQYYARASELRRLASRVYQDGNTDVAIKILDWTMSRFPDQSSVAYQAFAKTLSKNLDEGRQILQPQSVARPNDLSEDELNWLGYAFLRRGHTKAAIAFFETNAKVYPDSWNVYDSLAEACLADGQRNRAMKLYRRAIELNPEHWDGVIALRALEENYNQ